MSCCRRALFEGLIGDGLLLSCSSICRHQRWVDNATVHHVISVCESRCDWLRRTIIEAVLCELTRCWSVLASRCRRSGGPGDCRASKLSVVFVRCHDGL